MTRSFWSLWRRSHALRGVSMYSFMRYGTKALSLLRLAIVARFLGPSEIGVFGLTLLLLAISEVFTETGINVILLKDRHQLSRFLDTAWVISIVRGGIIAALLWLLAAPIAVFYQAPELRWYLPVAALIPLARGFLNPALIAYQQNLQFGKESLLRTSVQLVDLLSGLALALWWQSALGLVSGVLFGVFFELAASFMLFPQRPNFLRMRWSLVRELYHESKYIIGNGILHYLTQNIDDLIIGKLLGSAGLGFYQTAYNIAKAVTMDFGEIVQQIFYPILAREQRSPQLLVQRNAQASWFVLGFVTTTFVPTVLLTQPIVEWVFGSEWLPMVPVIRWLWLAGVAKALITQWVSLPVLANILQRYMLVNLIMLIALPATLVVFIPLYGLVGAGVAVWISFWLALPVAWGVNQQALRILRQRS